MRAVRRHPVLVAAIALAVVLGAVAWLLVRSHQYEATAKVLVTPAPYDTASYLGLPVPRDTPSDPTRVLQTASAMLDSTPGAAVLVARRLGNGWTPARVRDAVRVQPIGESNVLAVQARAARPSTAARVADAFARGSLDARSRTLPPQAAALLAKVKASGGGEAGQVARLQTVSAGVDPSFTFLRAAGPGTSTTAPPWRILALALFAGLVLGVGAALAGDALALRARSEEPAGPAAEASAPASTRSASG